MTATSFVRRLPGNPLVFGAASGIAIVLIILAISSISAGSLDMGIAMYRGNGLFTYLVPLSVALQMGLFKHYWNSTKAMAVPVAERLGVSGSVLPTVGMMACCVCCVAPLLAALPALGFLLAAASFVEAYKFAILSIAVAANVAGSLAICLAILRHKKRCSSAACSQLVQHDRVPREGPF